MFFHLLIPGKVARSRSREYLGHSPLKLCGNVVRIVALVHINILLLSRLGPHSPFVGICCMVHYNIQTQTDASFAKLCCQQLQIFVGTDLRINAGEIFHCIAAVVVRMGHFQEGHQMKIGDLLFGKVIQMTDQSFQSACKQLGVHRHTQHLSVTVPLGISQSLGIQFL